MCALTPCAMRAQDADLPASTCEVNASGNEGSLARRLRTLLTATDSASLERQGALGIQNVDDSEIELIRDENVCRRASELYSTEVHGLVRPVSQVPRMPVVVIRVRDRYFVECLHQAMDTRGRAKSPAFVTLIVGARLDRVIARVRA